MNGTSIRRMASNYAHLQRPSRPIMTGVGGGAAGEPRATSPQQMRTTKLRRYKSDVVDRRKPATLANMQNALAPASMNGLSSEAAARLAEDWLRVQRRLDLWVAIEELMEDVSLKIYINFVSSHVANLPKRSWRFEGQAFKFIKSFHWVRLIHRSPWPRHVS